MREPNRDIQLCSPTTSVPKSGSSGMIQYLQSWFPGWGGWYGESQDPDRPEELLTSPSSWDILGENSVQVYFAKIRHLIPLLKQTSFVSLNYCDLCGEIFVQQRQKTCSIPWRTLIPSTHSLGEITCLLGWSSCWRRAESCSFTRTKLETGYMKAESSSWNSQVCRNRKWSICMKFSAGLSLSQITIHFKPFISYTLNLLYHLLI